MELLIKYLNFKWYLWGVHVGLYLTRERNWVPFPIWIESKKYSAIKYYWVVHALNYFLPLFFTFYSLSWMLQSGSGGRKFKSNIFGNCLNLWRQHTTYIYLVRALYRAGSNTLQVCTIPSMWKSQQFLKQSNIENSFCAPIYPSSFQSSTTFF